MAFVTQPTWIERTFQKRECSRFIPSTKEPNRCLCGQNAFEHKPHLVDSASDVQRDTPWNAQEDLHWNPLLHSSTTPTDAYGTIEFQGTSHLLKARYVRVSFDTRPELLFQLISREWRLELPKLVISVHGGKANFELQPKLKKVIQRGLMQSAKTTGAWIITGGTNTGVMRHVGEAIRNDRSPCLRNKVITLGIAPWGIVEHRERLLGHNVTVPYFSHSSPKSRYSDLNNQHSYFILSDNGTVCRYGAEILLRKKLERYISKQQIYSHGDNRCGVPVVCVVVEGGVNTIRTVLESLTDSPPVPVVICDGSGRSADLLAFAHTYIGQDESIPLEVRQRLMEKIEQTFRLARDQSEQIYTELVQCVRRSDLITIFRMGEEPYQELDQAILTALLRGHRLSKVEQLNLALNWNRIDIAKSEIFVYGVEWPVGSLEQALMDALVLDRVEFVKCLLESGVSMQRFLTVSRLEELYNTKYGPSNTMHYVLRDVKKHLPRNYRYQIYDIGLVVEKLMGGAYRCQYCSRNFRQLHLSMAKKYLKSPYVRSPDLDKPFVCPFNELLIWAVLTRRQKMALFMWQQGEEAIVRALVASTLYKAMAKEAEDDDLEEEICSDMLANGREFETLALELLDYCYRQDDDATFQLLTHELPNWSKQTCLGLAVMGRHSSFLAHTAAQVLVADLWMGGLRIRKTTNLKVILGLLFPPTILMLPFKSKEELQLMPQTEAEHQLELEEEDEDDSVAENRSVQSSKAENSSDNGSLAMSSKQFNRMENGKVPLTDPCGMSEILDTTLPPKSRPLTYGKKIYEFYAAPITKFWCHVLAYVVFLVLFTYVVLVKTPPMPSWMEIYVILYQFTTLVEKTREIISCEPETFKVKLIVWSEKKWNPCDLVVIVFFFVGVMQRWDENNIPVARVFYCLSIMYWYVRVLDIVSVNKYLGPYVTMIGKMVINMIYFVILLLVVLMSYGVGRQGLFYPNEEPSWKLLRNVFFMPYWMIYGEVFADTIDPECGEGEDLIPCQTGMWINPAIMAMYLLVSNILLVNLLIAVFNNIFMEVSGVSQQLWKSQRYRVVLEFEQKPIFPPPLIVISHFVFFVRFCARIWKGSSNTFDHGLKLFLDDIDVEKIHDFEEECVEGYLNEAEGKLRRSADEQIKTTLHKVDTVAQKVEDIYSQEQHSMRTVETMKYQLEKLEDQLCETTETIAVMQHLLAVYSKDAMNRSLSMEIDLNAFDLESDGEEDRGQAAKAEDEERLLVDRAQLKDQLEKVDQVPPIPLARMVSIRKSLRRRQFSESEESKNKGRSLTEAEAKSLQSAVDDQGLERSQSVIFRNRPASDNQRCHKSNRLEYTSITDDLENVALKSPHPKLMRKLSQANGEEQQEALAVETAILRGAEEADYHLMGGLIQRRLRRDSENLALSLQDLCTYPGEPEGTPGRTDVPVITRTSMSGAEDEDVEPTENQKDSSNLLHPTWSESKC